MELEDCRASLHGTWRIIKGDKGGGSYELVTWLTVAYIQYNEAWEAKYGWCSI